MTSIEHAASLLEEAPAEKNTGERASWWQVAPMVVVLTLFFGLPMLVVLVVSFFDFDRSDIIPAFIFDNYVELFTREVTLRLYASSIKFALIVWVITLLLGFNIAYFLVFHVRGLLFQIGLFLLCTVPFLTSNIIRMISWIPSSAATASSTRPCRARASPASRWSSCCSPTSPWSWPTSICSPCSWWCRSSTRWRASTKACSRRRAMPAPAASARCSRSCCRLSRTGIALGSIFVITLVMGDSFVVRTMSGGQSASVVSALQNEVAALQYPPAAASAVIMVIIVTLMVAGILRLVDVRKELAR